MNPATCKQSGDGSEELCAVWTDPDFDPEEPAFYYLRVIENPRCRWAAYDCNSFSGAERPDACSDGSVALTMQKRAWTSPIWYDPQ